MQERHFSRRDDERGDALKACTCLLITGIWTSGLGCPQVHADWSVSLLAVVCSLEHVSR